MFQCGTLSTVTVLRGDPSSRPDAQWNYLDVFAVQIEDVKFFN